MLRRAHATFTLDTKALDTEQRIIEGLASTPELDRQGHSLDPSGAAFTTPLPLLWQHKQDQPIGHVIAARVTDAGIWIRAQIAQAGVLAFIDDAWKLIKNGLVGGLSVDWLPTGAPRPIAGGGLRFTNWQLVALSAVTVPANERASITLIKSLDLASSEAAASGGSGARRLPAASGVTPRVPIMNVSETLTSEQTLLDTKSVRLEELLTEEHAHGALEAEQTTERDTLLTEIAKHTQKVSQLKTLEAAQATKALPITGVPAQRSTPIPATHVRVVELPKGTRAVRWLLAVAAGKGSYADTLAFAKRYTDTPEVATYVKATFGTATPGPGSPPAGWGSQLVEPGNAGAEFVELLRPATIIGRIEGLRNVPFNIAIITQTGASTFAWVAEGAVKPVGEMGFDRTTLPFSKAAGIIVLSDELVRFSTPSAEEAARTELVRQCAQFLDEQFIQATNAGGPDHPAAITNGAQTVPSTGTDQASFLADLNTALAYFDAAGIPTDTLAFVMPPSVARGIAMVPTPQGALAFPSMAPAGGSILGYQAVVSSACDPKTIAIFPPSEIFLADDGRVALDSSNQATLAMTGTTPTFNLWQNNAIAIRAERYIRWQKRRDDVVVVMQNVTVGPTLTGAGTHGAKPSPSVGHAAAPPPYNPSR